MLKNSCFILNVLIALLITVYHVKAAPRRHLRENSSNLIVSHCSGKSSERRERMKNTQIVKERKVEIELIIIRIIRIISTDTEMVQGCMV